MEVGMNKEVKWGRGIVKLSLRNRHILGSRNLGDDSLCKRKNRPCVVDRCSARVTGEVAESGIYVRHI